MARKHPSNVTVTTSVVPSNNNPQYILDEEAVKTQNNAAQESFNRFVSETIMPGRANASSNRTTDRKFLRINDIKRIKRDILLQAIKSVNYLVGRNGQGKSSILSALSYLNISAEKKEFFNSESRIELEINGESIHCHRSMSDGTPIVVEGSLKVLALSLDIKDSGHEGILVSIDDYNNLDREGFTFLNSSNSMIGLKKIFAERVIVDPDAWSDGSTKRHFKEEDRVINISRLSQGLVSINNLRILLEKAQSMIKQENPHGITEFTTLILIEEPENNLHPGLQKRIPQIFNDFIKSISPSLESKIYLFVSTHSPFVVSAASNFEDQKVYLIDDGTLLDIKQNKVSESSGYGGHECAWIVGQMLGGDVTDLGYPENYCILEEYSLQVILEHGKRKGFIKNFQFVSASGASRQISLADTINEITSLNTLIKCNPYYHDKYLLIMDNTEGLERAVKERIKPLRKKLDGRFKELSADTLEAYYKNFDPDIYESTIKNISESTARDKGIAKEQGAIAISQKVHTSDAFSKLFNGELDFLLI